MGTNEFDDDFSAEPDFGDFADASVKSKRKKNENKKETVLGKTKNKVSPGAGTKKSKKAAKLSGEKKSTKKKK